MPGRQVRRPQHDVHRQGAVISWVVEYICGQKVWFETQSISVSYPLVPCLGWYPVPFRVMGYEYPRLLWVNFAHLIYLCGQRIGDWNG